MHEVVSSIDCRQITQVKISHPKEVNPCHHPEDGYISILISFGFSCSILTRSSPPLRVGCDRGRPRGPLLDGADRDHCARRGRRPTQSNRTHSAIHSHRPVCLARVTNSQRRSRRSPTRLMAAWHWSRNRRLSNRHWRNADVRAPRRQTRHSYLWGRHRLPSFQSSTPD